jgi:hypothetical protein
VAVGDHKKVTIAKEEVATGMVEKLPVVLPGAGRSES